MYEPAAISLLPSRAAPAMALYQLRLNRLYGSSAEKVRSSTCLSLRPLRKAYGR